MTLSDREMEVGKANVERLKLAVETLEMALASNDHGILKAAETLCRHAFEQFLLLHP